MSGLLHLSLALAALVAMTVAVLSALSAALLPVGFRREDRQGRLLRGFHHPDLIIGVEMVSGAYFDGSADRRRIRIVELASGEVWAAPTEDLIADRVGQ